MKTKKTSLNKFMQISPYDVFTGKPKNGKGKFLFFNSTVQNWEEEIKDYCKKNKSENCISDHINEDLPDYCLFGKTCILDKLRKNLTGKNFYNYEIVSDDEIDSILKSELEVVVF